MKSFYLLLALLPLTLAAASKCECPLAKCPGEDPAVSRTRMHTSPQPLSCQSLPSKLAHQDLTYCLEVHMSKRERNQMRQAMRQKADSQGKTGTGS